MGGRQACTLLVVSWEALGPRRDPVSCLRQSDVSSDYRGVRVLNDCKVLFNQTENR